MIKKKKYISINFIFIVLNILVFCGLLWIFCRGYQTTYIDNNSAVLGIILSVFNVFMIIEAKKTENTLVFFLQFWILLHVSSRIISLDYTEISAPLTRAMYVDGDINAYLLIMTIGVIFLWAGLHYKKKNQTSEILNDSIPTQLMRRRAFKLYWFSLGLNIISILNIPFFSGITSLLADFIFNNLFILIVSAAFLLYNWYYLKRNERIEFYLVLLSYAFFQTIIGSRSGFFSVFIIAFCIFIVLGYRKIQSLFVYVAILLLPVMIVLFMVTTYMRQLEMRNSSLSEKIELLPLVLENSKEMEAKVILAPVFDRIGYLDMGAEMYVSRDVLDQYITLKNEFCALIDGITPGFDVFDRSKACRIINASYNYPSEVVLSRSALMRVSYQSDILTIFGEYYLLFGIPFCYIFLFFTGRIFRKIWLVNQNHSSYSVVMKVIIVYIFYNFLASFGLDTLFNELVFMAITLMIFKKYVLGVKEY